MGIRFLCPNGHKLNVKADLAGKRASCPECGAKLVVPGAAPEPAKAPAAAIVRSATPITAVWYMQTPDGQQFGPATEEQFSEWIAAGRLGADSHVWRDGWPEWKVARDARDLLPKPLAAVPVASAQVAPSPAAAVPPAPPAVQSPLARHAEPVAAPSPAPGPEPAAVVTEPVVEENALPTAEVYALRKQRRQRTQVTLAVVMLLAVIVLAGILVWVIASNSSAGPPVSQASYPARESENT